MYTEWNITIYRDDDPQHNPLIKDTITCKDDVFTILSELQARYVRPVHDQVLGWASGTLGSHIRYATPDGTEYVAQAMPKQ